MSYIYICHIYIYIIVIYLFCTLGYINLLNTYIHTPAAIGSGNGLVVRH